MVKLNDETTLLKFPEKEQVLLQGPNSILWTNDDEYDQQQIQRSTSGQRKSNNSSSLATKIKKSVLSFVINNNNNNNNNNIRGDGLMLDDSCASSEVGFGGGIDPFEVAIPLNKKTSHSFPILTAVTPSPPPKSNNNNKRLAPPINMQNHKKDHNNTIIQSGSPKLLLQEGEKKEVIHDGDVNTSNTTSFVFNPFDVTPDSVEFDLSNSINSVTPLKLWPNHNSTGTIILPMTTSTTNTNNTTNSTAIIQPQQPPLQLDLLESFPNSASSLLFDDVTSDCDNKFTSTSGLTKYNTTKTDDVMMKPATTGIIDSSSDRTKQQHQISINASKDFDNSKPSNIIVDDDVLDSNAHTNSIENGFSVIRGNEMSPTIAATTSNKLVVRYDSDDMLGNFDDDVMQDDCATSTNSIENGFMIKGGKKLSSIRRDSVNKLGTSTNDAIQIIATDPNSTNTNTLMMMKGKEMSPTASATTTTTSTANSPGTSTTRPVSIQVYDKSAQTLSPCSPLVEVEVNNIAANFNEGIIACSPIKIKDDISVIDVDLSERFHFLDVTPFTSTPTKNLPINSNNNRQQSLAFSGTATKSTNSEEDAPIDSKTTTNNISSILRSSNSTPSSNNKSNNKTDEVLIQFHQEQKKNERRVKFREKASLHLLYQEEATNKKTNTTTFDGIRSTLQYIFQSLINCAEVTPSPKKFQQIPDPSSLQKHYYLNESSFLEDVGFEVHLNDTAEKDKNMYLTQQTDLFARAMKQLNSEEKNCHLSGHGLSAEVSPKNDVGMTPIRNNCDNFSDASVYSLQLHKDTSYSSFNELISDFRTANTSEQDCVDKKRKGGTSINAEQNGISSMKRISDLFDACHSPHVLELERMGTLETNSSSFSNHIEAAGGFHTPVRPEKEEDNDVKTNNPKASEASAVDKKQSRKKSFTSLIDGCQYPRNCNSEDDTIMVDQADENSHAEEMKGLHTPEQSEIYDIELLTSKSTEKKSNVSKPWLRKTTFGAVFEVCRSPLEYTMDEISEPSSVSFSPVNEPPLFVNIPDFKELSVIPEENANSCSAILEDLEDVAIMAATHQSFKTPVQHQGSASRKKKLSSGKRSIKSRTSSSMESKDSSNNSTISTIPSWTENLSTPKLSPSQDDSIVTHDTDNTPSTASFDAPQKRILIDCKALLGKENFDLKSEPGQVSTSRLRVGIRPLLQLHLDAAGFNTKSTSNEKRERSDEKIETDRQSSQYSSTRSTRIRAQAHTILEHRRYNIRRTKSESSIKTPIKFQGRRSSDSLKKVIEDCASKKVTTSSAVLVKGDQGNRNEDHTSTAILSGHKQSTEEHPHCIVKTPPDDAEQKVSPTKRKPSERTLLDLEPTKGTLSDVGEDHKQNGLSSTTDSKPVSVRKPVLEAKVLQGNNGRSTSKLTLIKNSAIHDIVRTKSGSGWEFKTPNPTINNAAIPRTDNTSHPCHIERSVQEVASSNEKNSTDTEEIQSVVSEAKTLLRSNVNNIKIHFKIKEEMEPSVTALRKFMLSERYKEQELSSDTSRLVTAGSTQNLDNAAICKSDVKTETCGPEINEDIGKDGLSKRNKVCSSKIKEKIALFERNQC